MLLNPSNCLKKGKLSLQRMAVALRNTFLSLGFAKAEFLISKAVQTFVSYYIQCTRLAPAGQARPIEVSSFPISLHFSKRYQHMSRLSLAGIPSSLPSAWGIESNHATVIEEGAGFKGVKILCPRSVSFGGAGVKPESQCLTWPLVLST